MSEKGEGLGIIIGLWHGGRLGWWRLALGALLLPILYKSSCGGEGVPCVVVVIGGGMQHM